MNMLEMTVKQLGVNARDGHPVVLLKEKSGERVMPIWVGPAEFRSISVALSKSTPPRPQTHDLMVQTLGMVGYRICRLEITEIAEDTFFGKLYLTRGKSKTLAVDCRPSDGIALALRNDAPILVAPAVLEAAGYPDQEFEQDKQSGEFKKFIQGLKASDFNTFIAQQLQAKEEAAEQAQKTDKASDVAGVDQPDESKTSDRESNDHK